MHRSLKLNNILEVIAKQVSLCHESTISMLFPSHFRLAHTKEKLHHQSRTISTQFSLIRTRMKEDMSYYYWFGHELDLWPWETITQEYNSSPKFRASSVTLTSNGWDTIYPSNEWDSLHYVNCCDKWTQRRRTRRECRGEVKCCVLT